jgi:hypothetical protein
LYYCSFLFSFLSHGLRFTQPSQAGSLSDRRTPLTGLRQPLLCWPQALKDRSQNLSQNPYPSLLFCGCKSTTFSLIRNDFF